ncbi:MAG: hypothetical protein IPM70_15515 [Proteobacteria bacterium]|nr:hypothetical protein [Pseudomonadota bacterium]
MSQKNPIRVFVTHNWHDTDDYLRLFEYLESANNFFYRNTSTPDKLPPKVDTETVREDLRKQINAAEVCRAGQPARRAAGHGHLPDELRAVAEEAGDPAAAVRAEGRAAETAGRPGR